MRSGRCAEVLIVGELIVYTGTPIFFPGALVISLEYRLFYWRADCFTVVQYWSAGCWTEALILLLER